MDVMVDINGFSRDVDHSMTEEIYLRGALFQRAQCVRDIYFKHGHTMGQREKLLFLGLIETAFIRRLP